MKTVTTYIANFLIGIVGTLLLVSQLTSGKSVSGTGVGFRLEGFGLILWVVVVVLYFVLAKKYWKKTVGGKIADLIIK